MTYFSYAPRKTTPEGEGYRTLLEVTLTDLEHPAHLAGYPTVQPVWVHTLTDDEAAITEAANARLAEMEAEYMARRETLPEAPIDGN